MIVILLGVFQHAEILFIQDRAGFKGRIFQMLKFKSMTDRHDENGTLLPADQRLSKIGAFLRWTSLDELPQLWNVLKGEMSIVGPRPLLVEYLPLFSEVQKQRHNVRPGITGWTQVSGRHEISWTKKLELDLYYVDHVSFLLDLKILIKTVIVILSFKEDISLSEKPFTGN